MGRRLLYKECEITEDRNSKHGSSGDRMKGEEFTTESTSEQVEMIRTVGSSKVLGLCFYLVIDPKHIRNVNWSPALNAFLSTPSFEKRY